MLALAMIVPLCVNSNTGLLLTMGTVLERSTPPSLSSDGNSWDWDGHRPTLPTLVFLKTNNELQVGRAQLVTPSHRMGRKQSKCPQSSFTLCPSKKVLESRAPGSRSSSFWSHLTSGVKGRERRHVTKVGSRWQVLGSRPADPGHPPLLAPRSERKRGPGKIMVKKGPEPFVEARQAVSRGQARPGESGA